MICFGVVNAMCSVLFGTLMKYIGRFSIIVFGTVVHMGIFSYLLFWQPHPDHPLIFFVISGLWGVGGIEIITVDSSYQNFGFILRCCVADTNKWTLWLALQTKQGSSVFKLQAMGISWICYRLRLLDGALRKNETLFCDVRTCVRSFLLYYSGN